MRLKRDLWKGRMDAEVKICERSVRICEDL